MNEELPLNTSAAPKTRRRRSGADMPEHMAAVDSGLGGETRESAAHSTKRPPRISMADGDLILTVADRYLQKGKHYRFFADREGRIDRAKAAYWEHVTDENGVNISRSSKGTKMYLMSLELEYKREDDALKMERYRASIGAEAEKDLGIAGLKTDTDKGRASALESHVSSDRDAY